MNNQNIFKSEFLIYVPIFSSRNKETGWYQPDMDGNLNSMLHKFWLAKNSLKHITIFMPHETYLPEEQFDAYATYVNKLFAGSGITFHFKRSQLYLGSTGDTRGEAINKERGIQTILSDITGEAWYYQTNMHTSKVVEIISELPIEYTFPAETLSKLFTVTYNYNWSFCKGYEETETLKESSKVEKALAEKYDTVVLSEIQTNEFIGYENVRMIDKVYSEDFTRTQFKAWLEAYLTKEQNLYCERIIKEILQSIFMLDRKIIIAPFRIDDTRYNLKGILSNIRSDFAENDRKSVLIISNPTNTKVSLSNGDLFDKYCNVVNLHDFLQKQHPHSILRGLYIHLMYALEKIHSSKETNIPVIEFPHYEKDLHVTMAEQLIFCPRYVVDSYAGQLIYQHNSRIDFSNYKPWTFKFISPFEENSAMHKMFSEWAGKVSQLDHAPKKLFINPDFDNVIEGTKAFDASGKEISISSVAEMLKSGRLVLTGISSNMPLYGSFELLPQSIAYEYPRDLTNEEIEKATIEISQSIALHSGMNESSDKFLPKSLSDSIELAIASYGSNLRTSVSKLDVIGRLLSLQKAILHSNERSESSIYFTGIGKNQTVAEKTANSFRSLGFRAHSINPVSALHGDMGMLTKYDLVIPISKSGETSELNIFLEYIKEHKGCSIFGLEQRGVDATNKSGASTMVKHCDYVVELPRVDELGPISNVPTMSTILMQTYLDIIAIECSKAVGYTKKDFISNHPGGLIGKS